MKNPMLSIVIPAFNEAENICNTARAVQENMKHAQIPYELIFVSDGSKDATFAKVLELAKVTDTTGAEVDLTAFVRPEGEEAAAETAEEASEDKA